MSMHHRAFMEHCAIGLAARWCELGPTVTRKLAALRLRPKVWQDPKLTLGLVIESRMLVLFSDVLHTKQPYHVHALCLQNFAISPVHIIPTSMR